MPSDNISKNADESERIGLMESQSSSSMKPIEVGSSSSSASSSTAGAGPSRFKILVGIAMYSLCSASLLLINKFAVEALPSVSFVLTAQFVSSVLVVKVCGALGYLEVDALEWSKVKGFFGVAFLFSCCLFTNVKALQYCNVETVIVARACSPIAVAIADFYFLGQMLPNARSWCSLIVIVAGAVAYVSFEDGMKIESISWVIAYFASIVSEMVYVKYVIDKIDMTTWGRVYYNNLLSIPPVLLFGAIFNDHVALMEHHWDRGTAFFLTLSCIVGVGISYAGFNLRALITATSFTVVGVVNKLATTAVNALVWDKHANGLGIAALVVTIFGGTMYQQSKKR